MQGMIAFDVEGDQANFHQIIWIPAENFTIALLVLPSILISISRTLEDILVFGSTSPTLSKNVTQSADDFKVNPASEIIFVHKELRKTKANKAIGLGKTNAQCSTFT